MLENVQKSYLLRRLIAVVAATLAAVALPQIFHLVGFASGTGAALGEAFLPMHLPVLILGLTAGPLAGLAAGLMSPLVSFALTGMPNAVILPIMVVELGGYGLAAGLIARTNLPMVVKLLVAQVGGRIVRAAAILLAVYALGSPLAISSIWTAIVTGLAGIVIQWLVVPVFVTAVGHARR